MVPGIAWVAEKRPWPWLRWLAAAVTVGVLGRIIWEPRIVGDGLGTTPVFNWLLWGYGVPAASFWLAGHMLRRRADDAPARVIDAAAILFTVMLIVFEVRHYLTGDPYGEGSPLAETALDVSLLLAVVIGLERLRAEERQRDPRSRRAVPCRHRLHHDRVQPGGQRQSLLHRRAGRRTLHQSDPARLRPAGGARAAFSPS